MYRLIEIESKTHDEFVECSPKEHFMQLSAWGKGKQLSGWKTQFVGLYKKDELVASSLILMKKIPMFGSYIAYAPRGYILDFSNKEVLQEMTKHIKQYCRKHRVCYMMIDPDIYITREDKKETIMSRDENVVKCLIELGYRHQGFNQEFEMTQPRHTFRLYLDDAKENIFANYSKVMRTSINNAKRFGITCKVEENIDVFYDIMQETAQRNHFVEHSKQYYEAVYNAYASRGKAICYSATYHPDQHLIALKDKAKELALEKEKCLTKLIQAPHDVKAKNRVEQIGIQEAKLTQDIEKTQDAQSIYPEGIVLSSGITLTTKHRAWLVYGGNREIYREVGANYAIKQFEIEDDISKGFEFVDFFGTIGKESTDKKYKGIHEFKKRFGGDYCEFPGEFHLVLKPLTYTLFMKLLPSAKKCMRKLKKRKTTVS